MSTIEAPPKPSALEAKIRVEKLDVFYGTFQALKGVSFDIPARRITSMIGPSGCGKSTLLRCFNRMNDLIRGARVEGSLVYQGVDLYGPDVSPAEVRRRM